MTKHRETKHPKPLHVKIWDKIWRDNDGKVVIAQAPNVWLYGWLVAKLLSLPLHGSSGRIVSALSSVSLLVWALLEAISGVNYFRKVLGVVIGAFTVVGLVTSL